MSTEPKPLEIVAPNGKPARREVNTYCPQCRAPQGKRVPSGGFGANVHDVCGNCGWDFEEFTCG